jgi:hypothetical protein
MIQPHILPDIQIDSSPGIQPHILIGSSRHRTPGRFRMTGYEISP